MAPGFVTMKDGRGVDPKLMEQQRRKLQEMVSSIQASMERHLKEQRDGAPRTEGGATGESGQSHEPKPCAQQVEELEEMESQDAEQSNAEPMDHS